MFASSVIRALAPTEAWYAHSKTYGAITLDLDGTFDADAMTRAFDAVLAAHPVLSGQIEVDDDGRHQLVTDDLLHAGMTTLPPGAPMPVLDPSASLAELVAVPGLPGGRTELTLFVHHSLADGHHQAALLFELFTRYTEVLRSGNPGATGAATTPLPLEAVLAARGIAKNPRSGLERFMPAMFAYDLPSARAGVPAAPPVHPVPAPTVRAALTREETEAVMAYGREHRLFLNPLLSAAILLAEWRLRGTPHIPIPYVYVVDLRGFLDPPVAATEATDPLGMATYLGRIDESTSLVDLARDVADALAADLADGVVQTSMLHFKPQYDDGPRGLPDVVSSTNLGRTPTLPTPPGLDVLDWRTTIYRASTVVDMYTVGVFGDHVAVEHHTYAPDAQRSVDTVLGILREAALR